MVKKNFKGKLHYVQQMLLPHSGDLAEGAWGHVPQQIAADQGAPESWGRQNFDNRFFHKLYNEIITFASPPIPILWFVENELFFNLFLF